MPNKISNIYTCSNCDAQFSKWSGRCLECGAWSSLQMKTVELKKLKDELGERTTLEKNDLFLQLEDQKNQAEVEKKSALAALDEAGKKFLEEREERKKLERKISMMNSQFISGGHKMEETQNIKSTIETHQNLLIQEFDKKIQDLSRDKETAEVDKQKVERYKSLLLKQRDIMIQLTEKLNERDDIIDELHDEIEVYDGINK